jgi:hypothetical protein
VQSNHPVVRYQQENVQLTINNATTENVQLNTNNVTTENVDIGTI